MCFPQRLGGVIAYIQRYAFLMAELKECARSIKEISMSEIVYKHKGNIVGDFLVTLKSLPLAHPTLDNLEITKHSNNWHLLGSYFVLGTVCM